MSDLQHNPRILGPIQGLLFEPAAKATCNCRADWIPFNTKEAAEQWVANHRALHPVVVGDEPFKARMRVISTALNNLSAEQLAEIMDLVMDRLVHKLKARDNEGAEG